MDLAAPGGRGEGARERSTMSRRELRPEPGVRRTLVGFLLGLALGLAPGARADTVPPGTVLRDAILVDLTPSGLSFLEQAILDLEPIELPLDPIDTALGDYLGCDLDLSIRDLYVGLAFEDVAIIPDSHELFVHIDASLWVNSGASPADVEIDFDGGIFDVCDLLDMDCEFWVSPTVLELHLRVRLDLIDPGGGQPPFLAAMVYTPEHNLMQALTSDVVGIDDCFLEDLIDILDALGMDVVDMLIDEGGSDLVSFLEDDLPMQIEDAIEGALDGLSYAGQIDVAGVPLSVSLAPGSLMIEHQGIRVTLDATVQAPASACVSDFDPGGSTFTNSPWPDLQGGAPHHVGVYVSDDLINAALYSVWRSGILCQTLDPSSLGLPLDTSFLALLIDPQYADRIERVWLGEAAPLTVAVVPRNVLEAELGGNHDLETGVEDLTVELYAVTQDRLASVFALDIDIGVDVDVLSGPDGSLGLGVDVDTADLDPTMRSNELWPSLTPQIEASFGSLITDLLDLLLGDMLDDLTLGSIQVMGIGLAGLEVVPAGAHQDYLGLYATVRVEDPSAMDLAGGCAGGDCQSSCALGERAAPPGASRGLLLLLLACLGSWWWLRRGG